VRCAGRCGRRGGRRQLGARTGFGSGRRSPRACPARTQPRRPAWHPRSAPGGSGRLAGCHPSRWPRYPVATCRSPSERRSPPARPAARCPRDRSAHRACAVDGLPGAAAQRVDAQQRAGLPGDDGAVARRAACLPPQGLQAGRQRPPVRLRAGPSRRLDRPTRRRAGGGPRGALHRPTSRPQGGSTVGQIVEPRADLEPAPGRLPR
jgi:hypothetical protein